MIPHAKLLQILKGLLDRSRRNQVNWQQDGGSDEYSVEFPDSRVVISYIQPETESNFYSVRLERPDRRVLAYATISDAEEGWGLASELYAEAMRCVTKWDVVLSGIEKALQTEGVIGLPAKPKAKDAPGIPF